jgi:hypothetical protein
LILADSVRRVLSELLAVASSRGKSKVALLDGLRRFGAGQLQSFDHRVRVLRLAPLVSAGPQAPACQEQPPKPRPRLSILSIRCTSDGAGSHRHAELAHSFMSSYRLWVRWPEFNVPALDLKVPEYRNTCPNTGWVKRKSMAK